MHSSTLLYYFNLLEANQLEDFRKFTGSDFINHGPFREEVVVLLNLILSVYPDMEHDLLKKENAHQLIFPNKTYSKNRMDKLMSEMNGILKEFIQWNNYKKPENAFYLQLDWTKTMRQHGDKIKYLSSLEKLKKEHESDNKLSREYLLREYLLAEEDLEWQTANYGGRGDVNLIHTIEKLNDYYLVQLLHHYNNLLIACRFSQIDLRESLIQRTNQIQDLLANDQNPLIIAAQKINSLLLKYPTTSEDLTVFLDYLKTIEDVVNYDALRDCYTYVRNFTTMMIDAGEHQLRPVLHEIQKDNLERGYFYYNGKITANAFLNIIRVACLIDQTDWAFAILEKHRDKIYGETENYAYFNVNKAVCLFNAGQYQEVLDTLPTSNMNNKLYYILGKAYEIKSYYELNSPLLEFKMKAFSVFLSRNTNKFLTPSHQKTWTNFIGILYQIVQCPKGDQKKIKLIQKRMSQKGTINEKLWLTAKLEAKS